MRVLYVEDDARDADLAVKALGRRARHITLEVARSLAEARARLTADGTFDLILLDLSLPDGSGLELVGEIRGKGQPLALVVMTGADEPELAVGALKSGADDYLVKRDDYLARLPGVLDAALTRFRAETIRRARPLHVLYAEDNAADLELTRRHFARFAPHIRLETVMTTRALLDRVARTERGQPPCDVLLLDSRPMELGTLEVLKVLRDEQQSDVPVVQITGQGDGEVAAQALRFGVAHYMVKHPGYLFVLPSVLEAARDAAERRRAESALRESERRYRALVDTVPGAVFSFRVDTAGQYSMPFISEGITRLVGLSAAEVMEDVARVVERIPAAAMPALVQSIRTSQVELSPWIQEIPIGTTTGEERWLRGTSQPVRQADGSTVWHGVLVDVTERKQAEHALRESERRYERVVRQIGDALVIDDVSGRVQYANQRFCELFGVAEEALPSLSFGDFVAPEWRDRLLARHDQRMRGEVVPETFECEGVRRDGTRIWVDLTVTPVIEGEHIVGSQATIRDVTGRVRAEQERRSLEAQLRQAQKMEALGNLAGGIAHDFNNLLTVITTYAELVVMELSDTDPHRSMVEEIHRAGIRAASLTQQILAFSRRQVRQATALNLNTVVAGVATMLHRLIGANITLTVRPEAGLRPIEADAGQLEQVIMNLAVNARDAMPDGGELLIETANVQIDQTEEFSDLPLEPGPYVRLRVQDTGTGIDAATRERLFEPFFTTKDLGTGTGLGLSIVYGIVQQSGGHVSVESEVGSGSRFTIYFPQAKTAEPEQLVHSGRAPAGGSETILVVEDEEAIRRLVDRILSTAGYTVLLATDGEDALRLLQTTPTRIDLLITDLIMPNMGGRELATRLAMSHKGMKVLFISGYSKDLGASGVLPRESGAFIGKPFAIEALTSRVRELLNSHGA